MPINISKITQGTVKYNLFYFLILYIVDIFSAYSRFIWSILYNFLMEFHLNKLNYTTHTDCF